MIVLGRATPVSGASRVRLAVGATRSRASVGAGGRANGGGKTTLLRLVAGFEPVAQPRESTELVTVPTSVFPSRFIETGASISGGPTRSSGAVGKNGQGCAKATGGAGARPTETPT